MKEIDIKSLKVGGYPRKSSDSEDKQVQSIETQVRELGVMAARYQFKLEESRIFPETKSAFSPGREHFNRLISHIERNEINALAAVHANRLARNPVDAGLIINLMDRSKLLAIITPTKIYFNTPTDKMMLAIEFIFSKKDSDDKSVFVKTGLKTKAIKGLPSGVASIGFLNDFSNEKGNRKWKVDEEKYPLISLILKRFLEGNISASRLYKWAKTELKLTTPKHKRIGGASITRSRIFEILKDPIYAGFFFQDEIRYDLDRSLPRPITEDDHRRIIQLLGAKHSPKIRDHIFPFTGLIRGENSEVLGQDPKLQVICDCGKKFAYTHRDICPSCGVKVSEMEAPKYLFYNYYYNIRRKKAGLPTKHLNEEKVNAYLKKYFEENLSLSPELAEWSFKNLNLIQEKALKERNVLLKRKIQVEQYVEIKKARYREMLADGLISADEYRLDVAKLEGGIPVSKDDTGNEWMERARKIISLTTSNLSDVIENGTTKDKREIFVSLGSNLNWDEKNLSISHLKSVQTLIDGINQAKRENAEFEPKNTLAVKDKSGVFAAVCPSLLRTWDNVRKALIEEKLGTADET